jgi:hypothetical protein
VLYEYDFSGLCSSGFDYRLIDDKSNEVGVRHTQRPLELSAKRTVLFALSISQSYDFNICGYTHAHCNPAGWDVRYRIGRAIQVRSRL